MAQCATGGCLSRHSLPCSDPYRGPLSSVTKARDACQAPSIYVKARDACQAPSVCVKARDACQAPSVYVKARDACQAPSVCVKARDACQAPAYVSRLGMLVRHPA